MIFLTFFIGIVANFIGYVPPGNINLTLVQITINRGLKQALIFIVSFCCVEFFFTYFHYACCQMAISVRLSSIPLSIG